MGDVDWTIDPPQNITVRFAQSKELDGGDRWVERRNSETIGIFFFYFKMMRREIHKLTITEARK